MAEVKLPEVRSNSIRASKSESEPRKEIGKVVSGRVTVKKKGLGGRLHDIFLADDFSTVKEYAIMDVIIPGLKHLIVDSISMLILGETAKRSSKDRGFVSYGSYYRGEKKEEKRERKRANFDYTDEIIFESRGDAELTLDALCDMCEQYGQATLADFYDLVGEPNNFTDEKWGWVDLGRANVRRSGRGYIIDLPKPYPLD